MKSWTEFCENKHIETVASKAKLNISKYKPDQLKMGYKVEKEHDDGSDVDVAKSDADVLKIVIAHLREDPNYYTKLKKVEGK